MSICHSPKVVTDGLVMYYDINNTKKSYKGKPTTNLIYYDGIDFSYFSGYTNMLAARVADKESPNGWALETQGVSGVATSARIFLASSISAIPTSGSVFLTVYAKKYNSATSIKPSTYSGYTWYQLMPLDGGSEYLTEEYRRFGAYIQVGTASSGPRATLSMCGGGFVFPFITDYNLKVRWHSPQMTLDTYAVPFTPNTRSATQSLYDLTGNITGADLSNATYNSVGVPTYNGTSSYIKIPNSTSLDTQTPSIEAWVKLNNVNQNAFIFEKGWVNTQYNLFFNVGNILNWRQYTGTAYNTLVFNASNIINTSNWYHITATYTPGDRRLYINGVQVTQDTASHSIPTHTGGMSIGVYGGYDGARSYYFNGDIAVVKVYNKALTPDEVKQNFNALRGRFNV